MTDRTSHSVIDTSTHGGKYSEHHVKFEDETLLRRKTVPASLQKHNANAMTYFEHEKPWRYEEDGLTVTRGSAWSGPGCHLGCGVLIYSKDDKVVRVEGDPDNPYNQGRLCPRCIAVQEIFNNDKRILYPMKRAREDRGKNRWERISWEEALDTVEKKFNEYKEKYGAESVVFIQGTGRDIAAYISRLAWSFGSPNYTFSLSNVACFGPRIFASMMTTGVFMVGDYSQQFIDRFDNPQWQCPALTVVWGNNPLVANSDGAYGHWVTDVLERGSKLMVVDPRLTWLAAHADLWLQVRPGSDGALALGIGNVMMKEKLYDEEFCSLWVYGLDEYADMCSEWTLEKTEEVTWVPARKIEAAAHLLAENSPALLQWGVALDQRIDCVDGARAVLDLFVITGNMEKPGSNIVAPELLRYITGWGRDLLSFDEEERRVGANDLIFYKLGLQVCSMNILIDKMIEQSDDYPIKASWIQTVNQIACGGADTERTKEAFGNLEFNVIVDLFMTPTAMAYGDLFLPVATYAERNGIRCGDGAQRGETINAAVHPQGECRSDMEINLELGKRFNPEAWPWDTVEDMFSSILSETGMNFEEVRETAPSYLPFEYKKYESGKLRGDGNIGFQTPSGRIELYSEGLAFMGKDPLPHYHEPTMTPYSQPELAKEFPLVLTTGARRHNTFHSENRQSAHLRAIHPEPTVTINPATASKLGISNGQWVWVEGPIDTTGRTGRAKRIAEISSIIDPRVVSTDHGWWRPEADPECLFDVDELNINNLLSWETGDSGIGANYKCTLCKIYAVDESEMTKEDE
ncbi:MAG: molybdopterin-dependent oxidoreductase [Coriobacteriales bacterium]|jgi:anaerobic selenocysteine-containing dehydrogenase